MDGSGPIMECSFADGGGESRSSRTSKEESAKCGSCSKFIPKFI